MVGTIGNARGPPRPRYQRHFRVILCLPTAPGLLIGISGDFGTSPFFGSARTSNCLNRVLPYVGSGLISRMTSTGGAEMRCPDVHHVNPGINRQCRPSKGNRTTLAISGRHPPKGIVQNRRASQIYRLERTTGRGIIALRRSNSGDDERAQRYTFRAHSAKFFRIAFD
jgi:hypothetical protein